MLWEMIFSGTEAANPETQAGSCRWVQAKPSASSWPLPGPFPGFPTPLPSRLPIFYFCFFPASSPLSLFLSCYFLLSCSSLFLLSCALESCWGRLLSQLRLQSMGPLPRSQCGRRKVMGRRGPSQREPACTHQVLWLVPGCSFRLLLCASTSPSSKPDAFKGCLQE